MEGVVLLLSYLIKNTMIITNTIATPTPPIPPAIGPILLVGDSGGGSFTSKKIKSIFKTIASGIYYTLNILSSQLRPRQ